MTFLLSPHEVSGTGVPVRPARLAARSMVQTIFSEVPAGIWPFQEVMKGCGFRLRRGSIFHLCKGRQLCGHRVFQGLRPYSRRP